MKIRPAQPSDEAAWTRVWFDAATEAFGPLLPEGHEFPVAEPGRWQALLADPDVSILMADEGAEVVGYAACGASRDPGAGRGTGELRTLFVVPGRWRGGVGAALVAAVLDDLRMRGYSEATVWSFADNDRANAFYERMGFRRDGAERTEEVWSDLLEVRYRRRID